MTKKTEVLQRMTDTRDRLWRAIEGLTAEQMVQPGVNGEWSVKDILAHMAFWEERCLNRLRLVVAGRLDQIQYINPDEVDGINYRAWQERREWTLDRVVTRLKAVREELVAALAVLTDEQLTASPTQIPVWQMIAVDTFEHDEEHISQILRWREQ